jgi:hypothetical protein
MRTVEVSRFIRASRPAVERLLTPETLLDYEGTFRVRDVTETNEGVVVTAGAAGMETEFVFHDREDGLEYRQRGTVGPFRAMETEVEISPENEGVRVTMRSAVSLNLPLPFADRIAAWKRRGEVRRALSKLAEDVE